MAVSDEPTSAGMPVARRGRVALRLWRVRALLLIAFVILGSFAILTEVTWYHGMSGFLVLVLAAAVLPRGVGQGVVEDAVARGVVEPRVRRSLDSRTALVVAALPDPVVVVNRRGIVVMHNDRARGALGGLRAGDPLSFALRDPEVLQAVEEVLAGASARAVEYQERVPIERWFVAHVAGLRVDPTASEGRPDHALLTLKDETDRQKVERMRVDFVANASHELRTPLASLSGFIETLQGPARNDATARERFLEIMRQQALRMSRLIDDLLSLSRIERNAHVRPTALVDIGSILRQTVDALAPQARDSGVDLDLHLPQAPLVTRADRDELYRVFENLIENGVKYGAAGGAVTVIVRREEAREREQAAIIVTVADKGPGIGAEHLPRLTERFYRVDTAASRDKGGTGLGLAIVKHIVARHRGRLTIDSKVGEGSTFSVQLEATSDPDVPNG